MKEKPLLSICIPTYNRDKFLDETIESVISQITKDIKEKVELCISDNASTDDTDKVIEKWKVKSPIRIVYNKNNENLGADRNYLKVIEIASGEYCWFLGSDDKIAPTAIKMVLDLIADFKYDILITNRLECDLKMNPIRNQSFFKKPNLTWNIYDAKMLKKYFDNVNFLAGVFAYISSIILRKKIWVVDSNIEKFIGTAYVHVYVLLGSLIRGATIKHVNKPLVFTRLGNDSFASEGFIRRLLLDFEGYSKIADYYFKDNKELYDSFLKILKRNHSFRRLITIQHYSAMKYFYDYLKLCGWSELHIKLSYYFRWVYRFKRIYKLFVFIFNNSATCFSKYITKIIQFK
ncbi:MAG: glycosyl transferase [Candidatus Sericytochromatia bacterium]|nr:MAG: glycosyl transferase [Candidatus Sericytochromatia bacterium]GIX42973.1 MAG: glycosyl transferase [Leptospiraceae bacterium]